MAVGLLSAIGISAGPLAGTLAAATSAAPQDSGYLSAISGYPFDGGNDVGPWGFDVYECTSYVGYRLNQEGVAFSDSYKGVQWGNAGNWISAATSAGIPSGTSPEVGAVAVWADGSGLLSEGHVAFVTSVSNGVASFAEYNAKYYYPAYNPPGFDTSTSTSNPSGKAPTEYLYFGYHYFALAGDFDDNGVSGIALYDSQNGVFYFKDGPSYNDQTTYQWAAGSNYQPFVGDFNGDGYSDIGLRDENTGMIYIKYGPAYGKNQHTYQWVAGSNYQVFAGNFNGSGEDGIGLRDENTGMLYFKDGPSYNDQSTYQWAAGSNYQPFVGDFNGNGYDGIGLRDANTGMFYFKDGPSYNDQSTYQWAAG
jgi:surface antigen